MDTLDLAILREMMSARVLLFGSHNPRMSAQVIARRLRLDPTTVRARLRGWEERGFLVAVHVLPNPRLFGCAVYAGAIHVPDYRARAGVLEDIAGLDGVLHSLEHVGGWVGVGMAVAHPSVVERRVALLGRMAGVAEVQPFFEIDMAGPTKQPSALDWRILEALRRLPRATLRALASDVGVSVNTLQARYAGLVRHRAVWSLMDLDFARFTGGGVLRLLLVVERRVDPARLSETLGKAFRPPLSLQEPTGLATDGTRVLDLLMHLPAVAEAEDIAAAAEAIPGVLGVEVLYPRRHRVYAGWVDERVAERAGNAAAMARA